MRELSLAIALLMGAACALHHECAVAGTGDLLQDFYPPAPASNAHLGHGVGALGDNVLAGAPGQDTAYLFDSSTGEVLMTFPNPEPPDIGSYASYIVGAGDRVLVSSHYDDHGATNSGTAYLFDASGPYDGGPAPVLEPYYYNPEGGYDHFATGMAFVGDDIVIGAPYDYDGRGIAYLFNQSSDEPVTTFDNPDPQNVPYFGRFVAPMGDNVLITGNAQKDGAARGGAYLFDKSGKVLMEFPNPVSEGFNNFGTGIAAVGNNVVVGAYGADVGATNAGVAYLFDASGPHDGSDAPPPAILASPDPTAGAYFGKFPAVAGNTVALGHDHHSSLGNDAPVYLFDGTTGARLETSFQNPNPSGSGDDYFGHLAIAAVGENFVVGAYGADTAAANAGAAYLFQGYYESVMIDIKPGSDPNSINLGSNGNVPVAIFATESFDATTVDPATLTLADAAVKVRGKKADLMASLEDIDADGLTDLLVHIETEALQLFEGEILAWLEGETFDGMPIRGVDSVRIVPVDPVPEPSTFLLLSAGALTLVGYAWRRRRCR